MAEDTLERVERALERLCDNMTTHLVDLKENAAQQTAVLKAIAEKDTKVGGVWGYSSIPTWLLFGLFLLSAALGGVNAYSILETASKLPTGITETLVK
jgi:hypothetical protein